MDGEAGEALQTRGKLFVILCGRIFWTASKVSVIDCENNYFNDL